MSELLHTAQQRDLRLIALRRVERLILDCAPGTLTPLLWQILECVQTALGREILLEVGAERE